MTIDEVMKMTDEELRGRAWEIVGGCWGEDAPDYPNDFSAAWVLVDSAQSGRDGVELWDLYQAMEALTADEPEESLTDAPITGLCLLAHLSPRFITRAFVLAAGGSNGQVEAD
jgi:hypothetical protein